LLVKDSKDVLDSIAHGRSGNSVLMLQSRKGVTSTIVKSFKSWKQFERELVSHKVYDFLDIRHSRFPKILLLGKHLDADGVEKGIMAMKSVPGESLAVLIKNLGKEVIGSVDRLKNLKTLQASFDRLAKFLAELHSKDLYHQQVASSAYIAREVSSFLELWKVAKDMHLASGIPEIYIKHLIRQFKCQPGYTGFVHGDVHPPNFLWDSKNLQSIDLQSLSKSIAPTGEPMGVSVKDYKQALISLEGYGTLLGLMPEEIMELNKTFRRAYQADFKGSYSLAAENFYHCFWSISRLIHVSDNKKLVLEFQKQFKKELKVMYQTSLLRDAQTVFEESMKLPSGQAKDLSEIVKLSRTLPSNYEKSNIDLLHLEKNIKVENSQLLLQAYFADSSRQFQVVRKRNVHVQRVVDN
jgi:tRNA A-37 threonylcarbamoyl transferase component Bud32